MIDNVDRHVIVQIRFRNSLGRGVGGRLPDIESPVVQGLVLLTLHIVNLRRRKKFVNDPVDVIAMLDLLSEFFDFVSPVHLTA